MFARRTRVITFLLGAASFLAHPVTLSAQCTAPTFDAGIDVRAGGAGPAGEIASGDLNGDGRTDLVVPRFISNTVSVIFGNASGPPTVVLLTVIRPLAAGVGDFNNDGKADLVVSHEPSPPLLTITLAVLLGDGAGGLGPPTDFPAQLSRPIVISDFNNDGNVDVFLGGSNVAEVHLGNGVGGLGGSILSPVPSNSDASAADFNNDGKVDLAMVKDSSPFLYVVFGDGAGHFGGEISVPVSSTRSIKAADLDNDGRLDLVSGGQVDGVAVALANGTGGFGSATTLTTGFSTVAVAVGDFNADGKADVAAAGDFFVAILLGNGAGGAFETNKYPTRQPPINIVSGDINGDTKLDLAVANCPACGDAASIFFGNGDGTLRLPLALAEGSSPIAIGHGDLNNDGRSDLAVANVSHNNVAVLLASASGGFAAPVTFAVGTQPSSVTLGYLNDDRKLDIVTTNFNGNTVTVLFGDGLGGFGAPSHISVPGNNPKSVVIADFNNDGVADLGVAYFNAQSVSILLADGDGGFGSATNFMVPFSALQVVVNDFNGDGKGDLAVATISGVSVLLGNGAGGFGTANTIPTPVPASSLVVDDFNGDGKADLAVAIERNDVVWVLTGDGQGGFGQPASFNTDFDPTWIAAADYNGDGNTDLATANIAGTTTILLGDGASGFPAVATYPVGGSITRAITSVDLNGDARPDLALANQSGFVSVLFNACTANTFSRPQLSISDVALTEGDSGTTNATFDLTLSVASLKTVALSFYSAGQTATKDLDYQTKQGRVTFLPGATNQTITVSVIGDTLPELDERFSVFLVYPLNADISKERGRGTIVDDDPVIQFSSSSYTINETGPRVDIALTRSGGMTRTVGVSFSTNDDAGLTNCNVFNGIASPRCDYITTQGTISFAPGETSKTFSVPLVDDSFAEGSETFTISANNSFGATLGAQTTTTVTITDNEATNGPNPIDQTPFFVRQQYVDFLGREPDPAGFAAWQAVINNCPAGDTTCDRIHVSSAFFRSPEFQGRGYFVYRFYPVSFGRKPEYVEFVPDLAKVSGFLSDAELEAAKVALITEFMSRPAFVTKFSGLNDTQFVDTLLSTAGVTSPNRDFWIAALGNGTRTRATVLRDITESPEVYNKYYNQAFVVMQYFGYLRRDPDALYVDWIAVLDSTGDYRGMVNGFMNSLEYRQRFGP